MNTDRLLKLLRLTESDNDHEAISALRLAQKMLAVDGLSVADLITDRDFSSGQQTSHRLNTDTVYEMLAHLDRVDELTPKTRDFVNSLRRFWDQRGYLTPRQFHSLKTTWEKHGGSCGTGPDYQSG